MKLIHTVPYHPESLVVTRDGSIDDDYYNAIYAAKRRQALVLVGQETLQAAAQLPLRIGRGIVAAVAESRL